MNILRQYLGFWKVQEIRYLNTTCIALYSYLIRVCNDCRRQNPFKRRNDKIEGDLGISRNTLIKARESLSECGLISFRTQNGVANVEYTLSNIDDVLEKLGETLSNFDKAAETLSETLSNFDNHNIKEKNNSNSNKENNKKKSSISLIPTKNEVIDFFMSLKELKPSEAELRAESFFNHFSKKGWRNGKSIIFDWMKAANEWKLEISDFKNEKESGAIDTPIGEGKCQKSKVNSEIKRFIPPVVDEVRAYCEERNNGIDAQHFVDHYTANGWMRGKTKVKDWKACVRTWEKNNFNNKSKVSENGGITESLARNVAEGIARANTNK